MRSRGQVGEQRAGRARADLDGLAARSLDDAVPGDGRAGSGDGGRPREDVWILVVVVDVIKNCFDQ